MFEYFNKRTLATGILFLLTVFHFQPLYAQTADSVKVQPPIDRPCFQDIDGDGFNDLAPDEDNDGIPNALDPDFDRPNRMRWGWFRSIPDSVMSDSIAFKQWWEQRDFRPVDWETAWQQWSEIRRNGMPAWMGNRRLGRDTISPRDARMRRMMLRRRLNQRETTNDTPNNRNRRRQRGR